MTLLSLQSSGGLLNPAFKDPIPESRHEDDCTNNDDSKNSEHLIFEGSAESSPKLSGLKRGVPVKRQNTPPSRPPPMKTPPHRPPLPARHSGPPERTDSQRSSSSSQHNVAFIDNSNGNDAAKTDESRRRSIVLPNSPFYTPSQDLLGLDHSLFHEIGSSLSDDTRSILTLGTSGTTTTSSNIIHQSGLVQSSENNNPFPQSQPQMSPTNPFASTTTTATSQERQMDLVFDDTSQQQGGLHRSPVLTRTTSVPMGSNKVNREGATAVNSAEASCEFDPFGPCFEEAKKDFRLTDKR